jgi:hypothetical protein
MFFLALYLTKKYFLQYDGLYVASKIMLGLILMYVLGLTLCWAGPVYISTIENINYTNRNVSVWTLV